MQWWNQSRMCWKRRCAGRIGPKPCLWHRAASDCVNYSTLRRRRSAPRSLHDANVGRWYATRRGIVFTSALVGTRTSRATFILCLAHGSKTRRSGGCTVFADHTATPVVDGDTASPRICCRGGGRYDGKWHCLGIVANELLYCASGRCTSGCIGEGDANRSANCGFVGETRQNECRTSGHFHCLIVVLNL